MTMDLLATSATTGVPRHRKHLLLALTLFVPVLALVAVEGGLRLAWHGGALPAFDRVDIAGHSYLTPSRRLGQRYFPGEASPPAPPTDVFAAVKPSRGLRIFVLGESTAAGFPYPHNGTFSRVVRDALRDVLPEDSVEVVNLAIAATNSYALVDIAKDVLAQRPDAVLIYAGHNEYYGALGVGSNIAAVSWPAMVRATLALDRLRTVHLLQIILTRARRATRGTPPTDSAAATFMESVARDQQITLGDRTYAAGLAQFDDNLRVLLRMFRRAAVPVFVASIASNVRDQRPFVSPANAPARAAFDSGRVLLATGDSARARVLLERARDLDVIRFRAPSAIDSVIRRAAAAESATYVPAAEQLESASPGGMPGHELFLEHVHPNRAGYTLIARAFFEALQSKHFLGRRARVELLAPWPNYDSRMALSAFDERIVHHTVQTVTTRWPFVERAAATDYRRRYSPTGVADSLALLVSRGASWADAKLRLALAEEQSGRADSALVEYRGLIRDAPFLELPNRLAGRALLTLGLPAQAVPYLEHARAAQATSEAAYMLGVIALKDNDFPHAIALLDEATRLAPGTPAPLYQLSLAFGLSRNVDAARATAAQVARLDPSFPGLAGWMSVLGMRSP